MKIATIEESGNNSTLLWAIKSNADIANDKPLISIINDELFYLVTVEDVNFFELFRLTQTYRNKVRVTLSQKAAIPTVEELSTVFGGETNYEGSAIPNAQIAENAISLFANMAMQMFADDDIIDTSASQMFLPMIARKFTVQIPYSFSDLVFSINPENHAHDAIFNKDYPSTLSRINEINPSVFNMILINLISVTEPIKYNSHYNDLLKVTKYFPIKKQKSDKLYRLGMIGFHKYNNLTRGETNCSLFQLDSESYAKKVSIMNHLSTPLQIDFAVQLPIEYMQALENYFSDEDLKIRYESSMLHIIDNGLRYNDFKLSISDDASQITAHNEQIEAYRERIKNCELSLMNTIQILLGADKLLVDQTSLFSTLPSIYMTNAVITYDISKEKKYESAIPFISDMLNEMKEIARSLIASMNDN